MQCSIIWCWWKDSDDPSFSFLLQQVHTGGGPTGSTGCLLGHNCHQTVTCATWSDMALVCNIATITSIIIILQLLDSVDITTKWWRKVRAAEVSDPEPASVGQRRVRLDFECCIIERWVRQNFDCLCIPMFSASTWISVCPWYLQVILKLLKTTVQNTTAHHTYIITQKYLSTSDRFFDPQLKVLNATANNTHPPQLFAA